MSPKIKEKRPQRISEAVSSARDETRTHTPFTALAPETSASTIPPPALQKWTANLQQISKIPTLLESYFEGQGLLPFRYGEGQGGA